MRPLFVNILNEIEEFIITNLALVINKHINVII